ncbi:MAG: class I SAM-dependent methyltransferase [Bacteroidota bacterium]|nr:class I SAM-dependent methyltransferase [Bacteroidota bacterium]
MKGGYNCIAPYYDYLSKIVFGDAIICVQRFLLQSIKPNSTILIIGGGTGWILKEIATTHPAGLTITYIDISAAMIGLSAKRNFGGNEVVLITGDIQQIPIDGNFDIVITPFLLDNFFTDTVELIIKKIDGQLKPGGLWLFADFEVSPTNQLWQKPLLKLMYFFFKIVCSIEANSLPDTNSLFTQYGYSKISTKTFFRNFITGIVFKKPDR